MKHFLYALYCSVVFSVVPSGCSSIRKEYTNHVSQEDQDACDAIQFSDAPDSSWRGIVNLNSSYGDMNGDFAIIHNVEDSLWAINISGPFGVPIFKARKSFDSLEVHWIDESGQWSDYRSWTQNEYDPIIPFGDLLFALCVGFAPGETVEVREERVFIIFKNTLYAILIVDKTEALSVLDIEGEEFTIDWKSDGRGKLRETNLHGDIFEASFYFR
ncbi:hypothetical protein JXA84_00195 [candidate division WOR-3 bacterium]|nr:hypothetical protein [candidate division WOR-3 bacterium]